MISRIKTRFAVVVAMMGLVAGGVAFSSSQEAGETASNVPALDAFHEVIHAIWHDAWPNKNTAMLRRLVPEVERGIAALAAAPLPGILRHKKEAWESGVRKLQEAGAEYKGAAGSGDDAKLLRAAETLHGRFRDLRMTIQPPLPELHDFHAVLYMLYHHYLPANDLRQIRDSADRLAQKMAALEKVKLPERWSAKESDFRAACRSLSQSVSALGRAVQGKEMQAIRKAVESVHRNYESMQEVF